MVHKLGPGTHVNWWHHCSRNLLGAYWTLERMYFLNTLGPLLIIDLNFRSLSVTWGSFSDKAFGRGLGLYACKQKCA